MLTKQMELDSLLVSFMGLGNKLRIPHPCLTQVACWTGHGGNHGTFIVIYICTDNSRPMKPKRYCLVKYQKTFDI